MSTHPHPSVDALIVATWYPGGDDPARGRFVADQAEALQLSGRVRPVVATFDVAYVDGRIVSAPEKLGAVQRQLRRALDAGRSPLSPRAASVQTPIPTARIPVAEGLSNAMRHGEEGDLRVEALSAVLDRVAADGFRPVIHAHTGYPDGFAAARIAKRYGWPLVITEHASFVARILRQRATRDRYLEAVRVASRVLAVSEVLAGELREAIPEIADKVVVMPNAIPLGDFVPTGLEGRNADELLFVGYRKERKGMVTLIQAFADVVQQRPGARLRLVGKSLTEAEEERWKQLARDLGVADAVTFDEPADRAGVADALRRASLFVHPSPRETFGITTLEALASGTPVVATRSGGISFILEDPELGELVPPQDSRALAKGVLRALERRAQFNPQRLRAAVEPYEAQRVAGRLASLYAEILEQHAQDAGTGAAARPPSGEEASSLRPEAAPIESAVVAIALDTDRAAKVLVPMAPDLLSRVILVTHGGDRAGELPAGLSRTVLAGERIDTEIKRMGVAGPRGSLTTRLARAARNPLAVLMRRLTGRSAADVRHAAMVAGATGALRDAGLLDAAGRVAPEVVCLDGIDYLVAEPLIERGALRPSPGGFVWLADRWASAQDAEATPSTEASRSSTADAILSPTTAQS